MYSGFTQFCPLASNMFVGETLTEKLIFINQNADLLIAQMLTRMAV